MSFHAIERARQRYGGLALDFDDIESAREAIRRRRPTAVPLGVRSDGKPEYAVRLRRTWVAVVADGEANIVTALPPGRLLGHRDELDRALRSAREAGLEPATTYQTPPPRPRPWLTLTGATP